MKILLDQYGLEILGSFTYSYKIDSYRKKRIYYKFIPACASCGNSYFMRKSYPTKFCSLQCSSASPEVRKKLSISSTGRKKSKEECLRISCLKSKGGVVKKNLPLYDTYSNQLIPIEEVRRNKLNLNFLEVRCAVCNNWFVPKRTACEQRCQYLKGNVDRENRFYCSDLCKANCSVFNKKKYPAGTNPRKHRNSISGNDLRVWAKEVLKRENSVCEYCGNKATIAHHILPKKTDIFFALDPDNGIACCSKCHYRYAHAGNCSTIRLSNIKC